MQQRKHQKLKLRKNINQIKNTNMKNWGLALILVGIISCILSLSMDTSVSTSSGSRVNNIGLMNDQQNYLIFSGLISVIGVLLFIFGPNSTNKYDVYLQNSEDKSCPQCAEKVKAEARICRFCSYVFEDVEREINWDELARQVNEGSSTKRSAI